MNLFNYRKCKYTILQADKEEPFGLVAIWDKNGCEITSEIISVKGAHKFAHKKIDERLDKCGKRIISLQDCDGVFKAYREKEYLGIIKTDNCDGYLFYKTEDRWGSPIRFKDIPSLMKYLRSL